MNVSVNCGVSRPAHEVPPPSWGVRVEIKCLNIKETEKKKN